MVHASLDSIQESGWTTVIRSGLRRGLALFSPETRSVALAPDTLIGLALASYRVAAFLRSGVGNPPALFDWMDP